MINLKGRDLSINFLNMKDRIQIWYEAQIELEKLQIEQRELSRKADRIHRMFEIIAGVILIASVLSLF